MADIRRHLVHWTGFPGAPGLTVYYTDDTAGGADAGRAFFNAIKAYIPQSVTLAWDQTVDTLDENTGALTGTRTESAVATVSGSSTDTYAAPAGFQVHWKTGQIINRRRLGGRTFVVPIGRGAFQTDGSLDATALGIFNTAAAAWVANTAGQLLVWHRPKNQTGGLASLVVGYNVPDKVAVLRSRRD